MRTRRSSTIPAAGMVLLLIGGGVTAVVTWIVRSPSADPSRALLGLPDAGPATAWGLPLAQLGHEVSAVIVVGLLFVRALSGSESPALRADLSRLAVRWSRIWVAATAAWIVVTVSELLAVPVTALPGLLDRIVPALGTDRVLAEMTTLWLALAVALFADRGGSPASGIPVLAVAAAGTLPSVVTGHGGHHGVSGVVTVLLAVHVVAASAWVGGLVVIATRFRARPPGLPVVLARFSRAALLCASAVALSGLVAAVATLDGGASVWSSARGGLVLLKAAAMVLLVAAGHRHRRHTLPAVAAGDARPLWRLGAAEILLMGLTLGVAVDLSLTG